MKGNNMAVESASLGGNQQAGLQALKSSLQSEAAVAKLVQQATDSGKSAGLSSSSSTSPTTDSSRALDVVI
jgi:hypothetical protein